MLALTLTLITAVYLLGPGLISRYILDFVVPRRAIQQTRAEEISRAIVTAVLPLVLAVTWVTLSHAIIWSAVANDVHTYAAAILSQQFFDNHIAQFFPAAKTVLIIFWAVAWRLYALLIVYALIVDFVIHYYGEIRESKLMTKCPALRPALALFVLPRISVWYVLLKSVSHRKSKDIRVDVITRRDVLYRGTVEDVLLAPDGALSGLLLTEPHRYQREKYLDDLKRYSQGPRTEAKPKPDDYWKEIPGHAFLVMSDSIETINLRSYERGDREMAELAQELNKILNLRLTAARGRKSPPKPS